MYKFTMALAAVVIACSFSCGGSAQKEKSAAGNVNQAGELATDPEQQKLWKAAIEKNRANSLANVPVPGEAVQARTHPAIPNATIDGKAQPLPAGMAGGVRFIRMPNLKEDAFRNSVRVRSSEGEQLDLDLGDQGILSIYARARGGALRVAANESGQLDLRIRDDPFDRQRILAVRFESGDGIVSALDSADKPVTITIPIFELTASQMGETQKNSMSVAVTVGRERQVLSPGQIVNFEAAGLTVGIIGSAAYVGDNEPRAEGRPYALNIVAWPTK